MGVGPTGVRVAGPSPPVFLFVPWIPKECVVGVFAAVMRFVLGESIQMLND